MSEYKIVSQNPSDFLCYNKPFFFMCECKEHKGASLPFDAIPQYERLLRYDGIPGVFKGIYLWLSEKDKVLYIPIKTIKQMKEDGEKSVGIRHLNSKYKIYDIPSVKKRVFMESDFSILMCLEEGE